MDKISRDEFITLLRQLVEIESPYFHEDDVMSFVNKWLNERDVPAEIHTFYEGKETMFNGKNVVGIMDSGKPGPWEWEEGAAETLSTFQIAADFCEEFDHFVFCHNEAILYQWIEEYAPALFAQIQSLVKQK